MTHGGYFLFEWTMITLSLSALALYLYASRRQRGWCRWRTASSGGGVLLLVVDLLPPVAAFSHHDLRGHMVQHLALGMFGPLLLVLAAPVTLLLRSLPTTAARRIVAFLRSPLVTAASHPVLALLLNVGGMYLLYLTPLYAVSLEQGLVHGWVHLHFIIAGCLFTWAIAGPDPGPRLSPRYRLVILFCSMATHGVLAKLMFAYGWPRGTAHSTAEIEAAARLMYYGGDIAELLLAIVLFHSWGRAPGRPRPEGPVVELADVRSP